MLLWLSWVCAGPAVAVELPPGDIAEFALPSGYYVTSITRGVDSSIWTTGWPSNTILRVSENGIVTGRYEVAPGDQPDQSYESSEPWKIVAAADGGAWFLNRAPNKEGIPLLGRITPAGRVSQRVVTLPTGRVASLNGIAVGHENDLWLSGMTLDEERYEPFVAHMTQAEHIDTVVVPDGNEPYSLAVTDDGGIWIVEQVVDEYAMGRLASGDLTTYPLVSEAPGLGTTGSLLPAAEGSVWFAREAAVGLISSTGQVLELPVPWAWSEGGLDIDANGNVWFVPSEMGALGRVAPSGEVTSFTGAASRNEGVRAIAPGIGEPYLWYAGTSKLYRLRVPLAPTFRLPPEIHGTAESGKTLSATEGEWDHEPSAFGYEWESCSTSTGCAAIPGEVNSSMRLTDADVGRTVRVRVTARNAAGEGTAESAISGKVAAPPVLPSPTHRHLRPQVKTTMGWTFSWGAKYTLVTLLAVRGLPRRSDVDVLCHGRGCPLSHVRLRAHVSSSCRRSHCVASRQRPPVVDLTRLFSNIRLRPNAQVTIVVSAPGWITKAFRFTVRANRAPRKLIGCLIAGSTAIRPGCE